MFLSIAKNFPWCCKFLLQAFVSGIWTIARQSRLLRNNTGLQMHVYLQCNVEFTITYRYFEALAFIHLIVHIPIKSHNNLLWFSSFAFKDFLPLSLLGVKSKEKSLVRYNQPLVQGSDAQPGLQIRIWRLFLTSPHAEIPAQTYRISVPAGGSGHECFQKVYGESSIHPLLEAMTAAIIHGA